MTDNPKPAQADAGGERPPADPPSADVLRGFTQASREYFGDRDDPWARGFMAALNDATAYLETQVPQPGTIDRLPLDELHADAGYLVGRVIVGSMDAHECVAAIRAKIDAALGSVPRPGNEPRDFCPRCYGRARDGWGDPCECQAVRSIPTGGTMEAPFDFAASFVETAARFDDLPEGKKADYRRSTPDAGTPAPADAREHARALLADECALQMAWGPRVTAAVREAMGEHPDGFRLFCGFRAALTALAADAPTPGEEGRDG